MTNETDRPNSTWDEPTPNETFRTTNAIAPETDRQRDVQRDRRRDLQSDRQSDRQADVAYERSRLAHDLHEGEKVEQSILIARPVSEVFAFWRDFSNLPLFMTHLEGVAVLSPIRSHWRYRTRGGFDFEWEAEIIAEIQNSRISMISWQTRPGSDFIQAGSVWFRAGENETSTEVHFQLRYRPPGGALGKLFGPPLAKLFGEEPSQIIERDLRQLRDLLEARTEKVRDWIN